jgi:hypothetical protein
MNKGSFKKMGLALGVGLLIAAMAVCGWSVHSLSLRQKEIKRDYSIANNISFGLLSVNKWRDMVVASVNNQIENFTLTRAERDSLEREISDLLNGLIDKADSMINAPQRSVSGKLRKFAYHAFVNDRRLHEQVPAFSHKIMVEVMRPRSRRKLAYLAKSKLEDLGQQTYDSARNAQVSNVDSIYRKYSVETAEAFDKKAADELASVRQHMYRSAFGMIGCALIMLGLWYWLRKDRALYVPLYLLSILAALVLLMVGLTSTMIEIDARIDSLSFQLLGETITFKNQVIFFQSKSILDVVALLIHTGKYDSIFVGVLILCFSIFFPFTKLFCTGIYIRGKASWAQSSWVRYFAFHSGKWSMADVMVVAIFMSYIGFNGILNDQMADLNLHTDGFTSIATNHTSLQPGYLIFITFVMFSLFLSQSLKKITGDKADK